MLWLLPNICKSTSDILGGLMKRQILSIYFMMIFAFAANISATEVDKNWLKQENQYVGAEVCRSCHIEHFDAWSSTLHSKMLQDVKINPNAIITKIDHEAIKEDFSKLTLKVPFEDLPLLKQEDILYTIGSAWKQRYLIKHNDDLYIAPFQFNVDKGRWVNYQESDWDQRPWLEKCGGCHATGVDLEKRSFTEASVSCEACHGKGAHHAATPSDDAFKKRQTIVNPAKLPSGISVQICGSCHTRGASTEVKGASWPVGYEPGKALTSYYEALDPQTNTKYFHASGDSLGHHQEYLDWEQSAHAKSNIDCMTCHNPHQIVKGLSSTSPTKLNNDALCMDCHKPLKAKGSHSVHSFGNCVGCHMSRLAKSAEAGDIRAHTFEVILPKDAIENNMPSSCTVSCHTGLLKSDRFSSETEALEYLQKRWDEEKNRAKYELEKRDPQ